ncbi:MULTISPECIES: ABC transporter permease [Roseivirga]|uniref:ABC transporter permease n=1 Tax=Roseivirga TaxID=290180 RepID=UPI000A007C6B|nr:MULTISPECIES: ABC transporter permease [Roseivirga]MBO6661686.1 ABC transporter permease [Roseivirga sp.]MBO6760673.1 ABC transporter permease [Roseivirga sp.]MBO6908329.1 ABC transporter permease [Roseivirga sp.]WPZ11225.1 ABC transporter permease [Roseivirga spongicola]
MLSNARYFIRTSIRQIFGKRLGYSAIHILGLSVGLASFLVASLYSIDEVSYDKFHPSHDRIYRLVVDWDGDGVQRNWARSSFPVGRVADGAIPEITERVRIRKNPGTDLITIGKVPFYEPDLLMVEPEFFNLFGFQLIAGNVDDVLAEKNGIVLTQEISRRYFGDENPIGKIVRFDDRFDLKVTGIAKNPPSQSHIQFNVLVSFNLLDDIFADSRLNHWGQFDHYTYLKIADGSIKMDVEAKMTGFLSSQAPEWVSEKITLKLQPIESIHLGSNRQSELRPNSNSTYYLVFISAALLILVVASFNYINLSYAIYMSRIKEIAIRQILGSKKTALLISLVAESVLVSMLALVIGMTTVSLSIEEIGQLTGKNLTQFYEPWFWLLAILIALGTGVLSGIPPAFRLLRNNNLAVDKGLKPKAKSAHWLIFTQLGISSLLIMAMLAVTQQLNFLQETSLGFNGASILVIPIKDRTHNADYKTILSEIESVSGIDGASFSSSTPGSSNALTYTYTISGANKADVALTTVIADESFCKLYDIKLIRGRLNSLSSSDGHVGILLNQSAVDFLELDEPIGKQVSGKITGEVVGVVEDFQVNSLHNLVEPVIIYNFLPTLRYVSVRSATGFNREKIDNLAEVWSKRYEKYPMEYSLLEDDNLKLYSYEKGVLHSINILVCVAVFIAVIGLIGHATLLRKSKAREFSIRKVLGASPLLVLRSTAGVVWKYLLFGAMLVSSLGFVAIEFWLRNFPYRPEIDVWVYVAPVIIVSVLFLVIVGALLVRQAGNNPIKYLRDL